jgi:hypothetical protein
MKGVQEEVGEKGRDVGNCCLAYGRGKNEILKEESRAEEEFPMEGYRRKCATN